MKGHTENSIVIYRDINTVFDLTNQVELWPKLFTEYAKTDILEKKDNYIKFSLTMYPDESGKVKSWISERVLYKSDLRVCARRLEPLYPFISMDITWTYEEMPQGVGVNMIWIQDFEVDKAFPYDVYHMESYLNKNSRIQMKAVKKALEAMGS